MIMYADAGYMMSRPYFSSSAYIKKMSNYKKNESVVKLKDGKTFVVEDVHFTITLDDIKYGGFEGYIVEKITHKIIFGMLTFTQIKSTTSKTTHIAYSEIDEIDIYE